MGLVTTKESTLRFYKSYHAEHERLPSVSLACREVEDLTRRKFYKIFEGGQAEVCRLAGIPAPEDRVKATAKAREEKKSQKTPEKMEEELEADEEEARLEEAKRREAAEERAIKARNELIKIEAKHDPKKIIPYLRNLEPKIVAPFFNVCKEARARARTVLEDVKSTFGYPCVLSCHLYVII